MASASAQAPTVLSHPIPTVSDKPVVTIPAPVTDQIKSEKPRSLVTKYPPLLPKKVEERPASPPEDHRSTGKKLEFPRAKLRPQPQSSKLLRSCKIWFCPLDNCTLRSHREFKSPSSSRFISSSCSDRSSKKNNSLRSIEDGRPGRPDVPPLSTLQKGVDGLPALPLDGLDRPIFRELFHEFFSYHYDKIQKLLSPPPISQKQRLLATECKRRSLEVALSAPVYCLHYIAAAHHQALFCRGYRSPDRNTVLLYGKIMQLLRDKLNHLVSTEVQDMVLVIFTLVMFEIAIGQTRSLVAHRKGLHSLINNHGGVHHMGKAIPFILNLDRIISIMTCMPPLYMPPSSHLIRKPYTNPSLYGSFWEQSPPRSLMHEEIYGYCVDTCRAIEIVEHERLSFDPSDSYNAKSSDLHYFFFYRECIVNKFVELNILTAQEQTLSRCVLLTTKIVEYTTLMDNYIATIPITLADRFKDIMCSPTAEIKWNQYAKILRWILFVVTCMSNPWDHRSWALSLLRRQLNEHYGSKSWPVGWRQIELSNVRQFVWSDTRFNTQFTKTCNELSMSTPTDSTRSSVEE